MMVKEDAFEEALEEDPERGGRKTLNNITLATELVQLHSFLFLENSCRN